MRLTLGSRDVANEVVVHSGETDRAMYVRFAQPRQVGWSWCPRWLCRLEMMTSVEAEYQYVCRMPCLPVLWCNKD